MPGSTDDMQGVCAHAQADVHCETDTKVHDGKGYLVRETISGETWCREGRGRSCGYKLSSSWLCPYGSYRLPLNLLSLWNLALWLGDFNFGPRK